MTESITLEQLRTLRAVVDAGSFSAAARQLGRVQAAVSQTIDRLEAQVGLRLFDRSGRTPRLTRHGEALAGAAERVMGGVVALDDLVAGLKRGVETSLPIAVDAMFPTSSLVAFARDFSREHPKVSLVLFTELLSAVTAYVRERRAAWGIALEDADLRDLRSRPVAQVELIPVVARTHPLSKLAQKGALQEEALNDAVQIVLGEHRREAEPRESHGVLSPRTWRVVDLATKHALIVEGLGWGRMPEHLVRDDLAKKRLVRLPLENMGSVVPKRALVLVWRQDAVMGPVARWAQDRLAHLCRGAIHHVA